MKKLMFTLCVIACIGLFSACEAEGVDTTIENKNFEKDISFIDPDDDGTGEEEDEETGQ